MYPQARAILWAQWRTIWNYYPRFGGGMAVFRAVLLAGWYGLWILGSVAVAKLLADPASATAPGFLGGGLLLVFLYWQIIPVITVATGASLELRKLLVYPVPISQLFGIEVLLRLTTAIEMLIMLSGAAAGLAANPALPFWAPFGLVLYVIFNLFLAAGVRDLLARLLARKRLREVVILLIVLAAGAPQLLMMTSGEVPPAIAAKARAVLSFQSSPWLPWSAVAQLAETRDWVIPLVSLTGWIAVSYAFGRRQFRRNLLFDAQASSATVEKPARSDTWMQRLYRLPSAVLADPLAAIVEKELRSLSRAPRFRLLFFMGFTFGLLIWLPVAFGRHGAGARSVIGANYLTFVSVYSLLLLGEVCFWNIFGFDRSAAQIWYLTPVPFSRVLIGKNITAVIFIVLEMTAITVVCSLLKMPATLAKLGEAYAVTLVVGVFLLAIGNLMSLYQPRAVNPASSFRTASAGQLQAVLILIYPVAAFPVLLAFGARYAFDSNLAFCLVLAFDAVLGLVVYRIALDSATSAAEQRKERIVSALSQSEGPIAS